MNAAPHDRLLELLADRAVGALDDASQRELDALMAEAPDLDADTIDLAAAAIDIAMTGMPAEPMPAAVRAAAEAKLGRLVRTPDDEAPPQSFRIDEARSSRAATPAWLAWSGWVAAAASLAFVAIVFVSNQQTALNPIERRDAFVSEVADARLAAWVPWDEPEIPGVSGEVVWSESEQRGFMTFKGLSVNDITEEQYQLWIIDERGLEQRVSGGVFDSRSSTGEVVIEMEPAVRIRDAAAFAVTIERPGGVWVSDMSRRVVIASLEG